MSSASQFLFGSIQGRDTVFDPILEPTPCDPHFNNVNLLFNFEAPVGTTSFTNETSPNFTISTIGNAELVEGLGTTQALNFPELPLSSNNGLIVQNYGSAIYSSDFTLEATITPTSIGSGNVSYIYNFRENSGNSLGFIFSVTSTGRLYVALHNSSGAVKEILTPENSILLGNTYDVALTREGNTYKIFIDGVVAASDTSSIVITPPLHDNMYIGYTENNSFNNGVRQFYGKIEKLRVTLGVARSTVHSGISEPYPSISC